MLYHIPRGDPRRPYLGGISLKIIDYMKITRTSGAKLNFFKRSQEKRNQAKKKRSLQLLINDYFKNEISDTFPTVLSFFYQICCLLTDKTRWEGRHQLPNPLYGMSLIRPSRGMTRVVFISIFLYFKNVLYNNCGQSVSDHHHLSTKLKGLFVVTFQCVISFFFLRRGTFFFYFSSTFFIICLIVTSLSIAQYTGQRHMYI